MNEEEECIHGLGPISACVICNGRAKAETMISDAVRARFEAKYVGLLACGHFSIVGQEIVTVEPNGRPCCDDDECIAVAVRHS